MFFVQCYFTLNKFCDPPKYEHFLAKLFFVKLHSDLRILTQLQLVGVGVDFVFPLEEEEEEDEEEDGITPT